MKVLSPFTLKVLALAGAVLLSGCASSMEHASEILANRPPASCSVELPDGRTIAATGAAACERLVRAQTDDSAMRACAEFSADNETMCVLAVALSKQHGSAGQRARSIDTELLVTAMQQDGALKRAWIGTIPVFGQLLATGYQAAQHEKTLRAAFEAAGPRVGQVNVGRAGGSSEGEGSASGEVNDNHVTIGNDATSIRGDGNVINDGRNPLILGTGQPEDSLDGDVNKTFENQAPVTDAPQFQGADDGDGGQSILPGFR